MTNSATSPEQSSILKQISMDRWPRGITYRDGFRILGTPLGFGNATRVGLRFFSSLNDRSPRKGERILTSLLLSKAIGENRGLDILAPNFGQKIRLGQMTLRLYPAGFGPGSAQLEVAIKNRKILYCGAIRLAKPLLSAPAEIPKCDLLLLDVRPAAPKPPAPATAAKALAEWLHSTYSVGRVPVVAFGSPAAVFDAVHAAASGALTFKAQRSIYELVRRTSPLLPLGGGIRRLDQRLPKTECILMSDRSWPKSRFFGDDRCSVAYAGPGRLIPEWAETGFRMGESEDRAGLISYIKETGAKQVALSDNCGPSLAALLGKQGVESYRITHPEQIPLPFEL